MVEVPVKIKDIFTECEDFKLSKKPVIGVSANRAEGTSRVADAYINAVINAGGVPLLIPGFANLGLLMQIIELCDGVLLTGGGDISPELLGEEALPEVGTPNEERDRQEIALAYIAMKRQIPLLGICRGHQVINVTCGGKNYQDIAKQHNSTPLCHSQEEARNVATHEVEIKKDSLLFKILGSDKVMSNSFHHQAVSKVAPCFVENASTADGVNEGIEKPFYPVLGVQWHPEPMAAEMDKEHLAIFEWLVNEAAIYRRAKKFHKVAVSLDSHCDTPMFFGEGVNIADNDDKVQTNIPKMVDGGLDASCMVAYIKQEERSEEGLNNAIAKCKGIIDTLIAQIEAADNAVQVRNREELLNAKRCGKKAIFVGIENGYGIGKDISLLEYYKQKGIIYMTLCHNGDNDICDSAKGNAEHNGLSDFGREVVKELNRLGIMVDLSHAGDKSFYDALELSKSPIIASHSSCRAICNHPRNLTDEQIVALADKGGVMQICIYDHFLNNDGIASVKTIADHIDHVVNLVGVDYVGIGTDFDGGGGVPGCNGANEIINLTCELIRRGYGDGDLKKIWGENFLRVLDEVKKVANF